MPTASIEAARTSARVHLPLALRPEAGGVSEVVVECADVRDALAQLFDRFPALRRHVFDETGALRPHVNVFVNDADVRSLSGLATRMRTGDQLHIVPSIAGG